MSDEETAIEITLKSALLDLDRENAELKAHIKKQAHVERYIFRRCGDLESKYGLTFSEDYDTKKWTVKLELKLLECESRLGALSIVEAMEPQLRELISAAKNQGGGLPVVTGGVLNLSGGSASGVGGIDIPAGTITGTKGTDVVDVTGGDRGIMGS